MLLCSCGSVWHTGNNQSSAGDGDDNALDQVPAAISLVGICVTIHDAASHRQNLGQVRAAFLRDVNVDGNVEIACFDLIEDYCSGTARMFGEVYRRCAELKFKAVDQGFISGLEAKCNQFVVAAA